MTLTLLPIAIAAATPLLLAALGELVVERSGLLNIGLEGMMLSAALSAAVVAGRTGSVGAGFVAGIFGAMLAGVVFGVFAIHLKADQIITGAAINFIALGVTGGLYRAWNRGDALVQGLPAVGTWKLAVLGDLPSIGPLLFRFDPVVVVSWLVIPSAIAFMLHGTRTGLRLRACGENPAAVAASGESVVLSRWLALGVEILCAGLAGAYLSLGLSPGFAENMVAGRGFIALAIVVFARWTSMGTILGVALFGVTAAIQYALQARSGGFSFHLLLALPYVVTIVILALVPKTVAPPEALGRA